MGFDAVLVTVEDRTQAEIAFEVFEGFLDLCKQHVELPDLGRVICAEVGAQQVAAFATAELAQFVLAQAEGESAVFCDLDFYHSPSGWILAFGGAKFEQQCVAGRGHALEFGQPGPEFFELAGARNPYLERHPFRYSAFQRMTSNGHCSGRGRKGLLRVARARSVNAR